MENKKDIKKPSPKKEESKIETKPVETEVVKTEPKVSEKPTTLFDEYVSRIEEVNGKFVIYGIHFATLEDAKAYVKKQLK